MKCHCCKREINIEKHTVPPEWFGLYQMVDLIRVICKPCERDPVNKDWFRINPKKKW